MKANYKNVFCIMFELFIVSSSGWMEWCVCLRIANKKRDWIIIAYNFSSRFFPTLHFSFRNFPEKKKRTASKLQTDNCILLCLSFTHYNFYVETAFKSNVRFRIFVFRFSMCFFSLLAHSFSSEHYVSVQLFSPSVFKFIKWKR